MTFGPFPAALQNAIQQGFLERAFQDPLLNVLAYRKVADKEVFSGRIGETITKTRMGLMVPNTTPLNPATNTGLDNGTTPQQYTDEQYTLSIAQYPQVAPPINLIDDETTIASFAMRNSFNLGVAQPTCVDRLARSSLFNSYMSGNTAITVTATSVTQNVDDTRGFQTVVVNGSVVAVSVTNPLPVYVNGTLRSVTGFANDLVNISTAIGTGGTSGTLTFSASFTGTAAQAVRSYYAPLIIRPNARTTTGALISSDLLTMRAIFSAVTQLRNNAVPPIDGAYNLYLNSTSMEELYQDSEFQILNRGVSTRDPNYENAWVMDKFLQVRFVMTTETYIQDPAVDASYTVSQTVQRPILVGQGALVEGMFTKGIDALRNMLAMGGVGAEMRAPLVYNLLGEEFMQQGFFYYLRQPIDQLGQIITQASNYVGGFTVPTDVTTNRLIIPTASNAFFKRAVIIETA